MTPDEKIQRLEAAVIAHRKIYGAKLQEAEQQAHAIEEQLYVRRCALDSQTQVLFAISKRLAMLSTVMIEIAGRLEQLTGKVDR